MEQFLQQGARHSPVMLGRLVGIGGRAEGYRFIGEGRPLQLPAQRSSGSAFDEDLLLEVSPAGEIEEGMGVAGVAIAAGELTASVGVDCPDEGQPSVGRTVEDLADAQFVILDARAAAQRLGIRIGSSHRRYAG